MFHVVYWAAIRSGLYLTAVNRYLAADEAAYIINDSGSRSLITTAALADTARAVRDMAPECSDWLMLDGDTDGFTNYHDAVDAHSRAKLDEEPLGTLMLYSSGTTGRPKGDQAGAHGQDGRRSKQRRHSPARGVPPRH